MGKGINGEREPLHRHAYDKRLFYFLVETDPPTVDQFRSHAARGEVPAGVRTPAQRAPYHRLSLWATEEQARQCAGRTRRRYDYIAVLEVPADAPVVRRGKNAGHHEIEESIAPPELLHSWVARIVPVR